MLNLFHLQIYRLGVHPLTPINMSKKKFVGSEKKKGI